MRISLTIVTCLASVLCTPAANAQKGSATHKTAIEAYMKAAKAGDSDEALRTFDPKIRRLFSTQIAIEDTLVNQTLLEDAIADQPEFQASGFSFLFAQRDIVRPTSFDILSHRQLCEKRWVYEIKTTERSYDQDRTDTVVRSYLVIKRQGRWYVFRPLGYTSALLSGWMPPPVITIIKAPDEQTRPGIDFEMSYNVPIEVVHEQLVRLNRHPQLKQHEKLVQQTGKDFQRFEN